MQKYVFVIILNILELKLDFNFLKDCMIDWLVGCLGFYNRLTLVGLFNAEGSFIFTNSYMILPILTNYLLSGKSSC